MALGRFSDDNLVLKATVNGGAWSGALPLANLKEESRFVSAPARQLSPNDPNSARIDVGLLRPRAVNLIGVLFHTLGLSAEYRLTIAAPGGTLAAPASVGDWTPVHGRMFPSASLPWEEPNWWTGLPLAEDLPLYPRHLWIVIDPAVLMGAFRLEFRDPVSAWFDIGGLWACGAWSPRFNFEHGRELAAESRTVSEEGPSGRVFHEDRQSRRRLTVAWSMLDRDEALKLFDAGGRAGTRRPVVVMPDQDDPVSRVREAFPATFEKPPAPRLARKFENQVAATFKEIIA